jgi:hypothetical protein
VRTDIKVIYLPASNPTFASFIFPDFTVACAMRRKTAAGLAMVETVGRTYFFAVVISDQ